MKRRCPAFTLIELLVVVAIIALLVSILMPALGKARSHANAVKCQSQLHQWAMAFDMVLQEHRGEFMSGVEDDAADVRGGWWRAFTSEYVSTEDNLGIWGCPGSACDPPYEPGEEGLPGMELPPGVMPGMMPGAMPGMMPPGAMPSDTDFSGPPGMMAAGQEDTPRQFEGLRLTDPGKDSAWAAPGVYAGSYGFNGWLYNPPAGQNLGESSEERGQSASGGHITADRHWRSIDRLRPAGNIPLLAESYWVDGRPLAGDEPPPGAGGYAFPEQADHMQRFCIDRHDGRINIAFADGSARPVALKQLWRLTWHEGFTPMTPVWPDWMANFRDR